MTPHAITARRLQPTVEGRLPHRHLPQSQLKEQGMITHITK
jgi:hypothetical protein